MAPAFRSAPPLVVSTWLNSDSPPTLEALLGRVVLLHVFQMRCTGCIEFATPQAQRVHTFFSADEVAVIGLHSVFEHHESNSVDALRAFVRDQRLTFPIAVDAADGRNGIPLTMRALALQGTPSLVLLDRRGRIRMKRLGHVPDLELGAAVATLVGELPAQETS